MDLWLLGIIPIAFIQNAIFTLVSRSRGSADLSRHFKAAIGSNGIYLVTSLFVWRAFWPLFYESDWQPFITLAVIYTLSTAAGSVFMMAAAIGRFENVRGLKWVHALFAEKGKSRVGSRK